MEPEVGGKTTAVDVKTWSSASTCLTRFATTAAAGLHLWASVQKEETKEATRMLLSF